MLKGQWRLENDSILVFYYKQESIYNYSAYNNYQYYLKRDKSKAKKPEALRIRLWIEEKRFLINREKSLCMICGLNRCYRVGY